MGAVGVAVLAPPLRFVQVPPGGRVVRYEEGATAAVSVVEDADGVRRLYIDDRQQEGSSATLRVDGRQAWVPLLLHPSPRRALFLGLGTGMTASSAAEDPTLAVDAVELLPEVIAASASFAPSGSEGAGASRLRVLAADARRYVRAGRVGRVGDEAYDVIVADNVHPARSGSGALYTVEHFAAVRRRLAPGGVFCQWLPLHQLDLETLRIVVRSFVEVNPRAWAVLASNSLETPVLGLVTRNDADPFDAGALRDRRARAAVPSLLANLGLEDELAVLGSVVAGPASLRRFAGDAVMNTDDHPRVAYRAPLLTYAPGSTPRDRLLALLGQLAIDPAELVAPGDANEARRLAAYWRARDRFLASGRDVRASSDVRAMLAQVREPLLDVLRISPDFRPAYDPLVAMAAALARIDARDAQALLAELARLQPARPEATRLLAQIDRR
jgi:spermidine synthase